MDLEVKPFLFPWVPSTGGTISYSTSSNAIIAIATGFSNAPIAGSGNILPGPPVPVPQGLYSWFGYVNPTTVNPQGTLLAVYGIYGFAATSVTLTVTGLTGNITCYFGGNKTTLPPITSSSPANGITIPSNYFFSGINNNGILATALAVAFNLQSYVNTSFTMSFNNGVYAKTYTIGPSLSGSLNSSITPISGGNQLTISGPNTGNTPGLIVTYYKDYKPKFYTSSSFSPSFLIFSFDLRNKGIPSNIGSLPVGYDNLRLTMIPPITNGSTNVYYTNPQHGSISGEPISVSYPPNLITSSTFP
jgi:hypothetical protein